ncbi:hypothetical protein, partial [Mesorhizobium sp. M4B.F.Ca.ET.214.01.1.1]|uniref:hypothetical protein n=1 Tax=Mesorhizobium sp. M4B.F.Ca.ET.214.01.1.1 TaxID=2563955 RepID=UPI001AED2203
PSAARWRGIEPAPKRRREIVHRIRQDESYEVSVENRSGAYLKYVSTGSAGRCRLQAGLT